MTQGGVNETLAARRPLARRYNTGFAAWQATLGYICANYTPDILLKMQATINSEGEIRWTASLTGEPYFELVSNEISLGGALSHLWDQVSWKHQIFLHEEDATRQPTGYDELDWLDMSTNDVLHRLLWTIKAAFRSDWSLMIVYQPREESTLRIQMRLLADANRMQVGSRGPSLIAAARQLFRNAAPEFAKQAGFMVDS